MHWSGNRLVILTTTFTYLSSLVVTYMFLREIRVQQVLAPAAENTDPSYATVNNDVELQQIQQLGGSAAIRIGANPAATAGQLGPSATAATAVKYSKLSLDRQESSDSFLPATTGAASSTPMQASEERSVRGVGGGIEMTSPLHHRLHPTSTSISTSGRPGSSFAISDPDDEEDESTVPGGAGLQAHTSAASNSSGADSFEVYTPIQEDLRTICGALIKSATFWRFAVLTLFLINLNTIFRHLDATLPTYLIRCFGSNYPKGIVYSINPFIIMFMTPVVAALTSTAPHYDMIKYGGYVSAASPFFLAMATSTWAVVLFVIFLSVGEAIWSPRIYDYTMSIAPEVRVFPFPFLCSCLAYGLVFPTLCVPLYA
jgi:hypothetical protein